MKNLSRILLIAFSIMLIVIHAVSPAAALNNTTDNLEAAGFTPQERNSYDSIYTLLRIPGYDYPVLAFQSGESETTFRLYGTIEKKTGYYPAEVAIADVGTENERYIISISDPEPVKNDKKLLAKLSSASYETLPEGFTAIGKTGCVVKMTNIFGTDETYIYGTYGNPENPDAIYGWYKSKNTSSVPGSLMISLSDASLRIKPDDVRKFSLPRELKNGFSQKVTIWCSNGFQAEVTTFYPEIDYEALQAEVRHQQETKSGVFTEYTTESIPFDTKVKENRDRYAAEGDIVLQEGVPGEEQITWKVTYSDGQETARKKAGSKTVRKPVTRIVERGTRKQEEAYIFSDNVKVYAGADSSSVTEGSPITANGVIKVSGSAPKGGYSCKLSIVNEAGETVASSSRDFPASVSYANAPAGTYTVHASATSTDDGSVVNSTFRIVVSKASGSSEEKEPDPVPQPVVTTETVTETEEIAFDTEYINDDTIFEDTPESVIRAGVPGKKVIAWSITFTDGKETAREKVSETVSVEPLSKQIRRGTRKHVTETRTETATESIPVETEYISDSTRFTDDPEVVLRSGSAGQLTVTYHVTYYDGKETSRNRISEDVTTAMVTRQISRGTKTHSVTYEEVTVMESIPFTTIREPWDTLEVGEEVATGEGTNGEKQITYRITLTDGQETAREAVSEKVTRQPVNAYIAYGTFEPTYTYEYVSVGLPGAHGQNTLSGAAASHAMAMAQSHSVYHAGSGYTESVGGWSSAGAVGGGLMSHVPSLAACEFYGVGCVKCTKTCADGTTKDTYYGVAYGGGGILLDENGEIWY